MSDVAATEPVEEAEPEVAPEAEAVEEQAEGEEETVETAEVEFDGQTYSVPFALKDAVMKSADYTHKTQELAEKGRQAEATLGQEREALYQQVQTQRQNIALYGQLEHVEDQLAQFDKVDMVSLHREDPDKAQEMSYYRDNLRSKRDDLEDAIEKQERESRVAAEREHANRKNQLESTLARDIPNYSPELRGEMHQTAIRHGFTEQDLNSVLDPRMMKMLHLAHLGEQVVKRQTATPKPKPVKPVSKVTGGSSPEKGPADNQSIDSWMKRRNAQQRG